jgi:hypothetical protein
VSRGGRTARLHAQSRRCEFPTRQVFEVSCDLQANREAGRLRGQGSSLPSVENCYDCANCCLDMWNDSVDHTAWSSLLQMADAWLLLAFEFRQAALGGSSLTASALFARLCGPRKSPAERGSYVTGGTY